MNQWLQQNLGRGATVATGLKPYPPNSIPGQCVTAASSWSMFLGGPQLFGIGDDSTAYEIFLNFRHPFFEVIQGAADIQPGDIVFYLPNNKSAGTGPDGHVDVCIEIIPDGFIGVDMDWDGNGNLQSVPHNLSGVAGVFRPTGGIDMIDIDEDLAELITLLTTGWPNPKQDGGAFVKSLVGQTVDQAGLSQMLNNMLATPQRRELIDKLNQPTGVNHDNVLAYINSHLS